MFNIDAFKAHLVSERKSPNTIESYVTSVRKYSDWFADKYGKQPSILLRDNVVEYMDAMKSEGIASKTFNLRLTGLRALNDYLVSIGIQTDVVINNDDHKRIQQRYASPAEFGEPEVNRFVQTVLEGGEYRDYALARTFEKTGLRISEALDLTLDDVHFDSREIIVRNGKCDKERTVYMSDSLTRTLREYIDKHRSKFVPAENSPYVFVSNRNPQLSRMTVNKAFKAYSAKAGVGNITPHDLRHYFCSRALEVGFDVHEVAALAGHSNVHTTLLYTNPSRKAMLEKANRI